MAGLMSLVCLVSTQALPECPEGNAECRELRRAAKKRINTLRGLRDELRTEIEAAEENIEKAEGDIDNLQDMLIKLCDGKSYETAGCPYQNTLNAWQGISDYRDETIAWCLDDLDLDSNGIDCTHSGESVVTYNGSVVTIYESDGSQITITKDDFWCDEYEC